MTRAFKRTFVMPEVELTDPRTIWPSAGCSGLRCSLSFAPHQCKRLAALLRVSAVSMTHELERGVSTCPFAMIKERSEQEASSSMYRDVQHQRNGRAVFKIWRTKWLNAARCKSAPINHNVSSEKDIIKWLADPRPMSARRRRARG